MQKVKEALAEAERTVEVLHTLPSARLPTRWDRLFAAAKPFAQGAALLGYCMVIHAFHATSQILGGMLLAVAVGLRGYSKGSLSASGSIAALFVGWATLASSFRAGLVLLAFFFSSSMLTTLGEEQKQVDEGHKAGGQRDWRQVACNGAVPAVLAVAAAAMTGGMDAPLRASINPTLTALYGAFLGYFACCTGDTWASELGQLSEAEPRLITSMRPVRKGTNGGVTLVGLAASVAGGLLMGVVFYAAGAFSPSGSHAAVAIRQWQLVPLGLAAGLIGSIIDSVLGATVQFTGYNRQTGKITGRIGPEVTPISGVPFLDNNLVNLVSATATAAVTGLFALLLF